MIRRLALLLALGAPVAAQDRVAGYDEMGPDLQAMQDDPFMNPGMLWVGEGADLWEATPEGGGPACASCHGAANDSMRGVAARCPAYDAISDSTVDLPGRITLCQTRHQGTAALSRDSRPLIALTAFVARQSAGLPITPDPDPRLTPLRSEGAALFQSRMGQLNLSGAQCHDDNAGGRLLAALIPQAHPTGYPQYRLEWEEMGPLQRRFDNCLTGVRADPFASGSREYIGLELYLMERAAGMRVEAPAIRP